MADTPPDLTPYIEATARLLGLAIEPLWRPGVVRHLDNFRRLAEAVDRPGEVLPDDPAAVYRP